MDIDELRSLFLFESLTDEQLEQLVEVGEEIVFHDRTELFQEGAPADSWWVLLEGPMQLLRHSGRQAPQVIRTMDRPGLWAGGFRAWDDAGSYLATGRGAGDGRVFRVPSPALGEIVRGWFPFGIHLIEGFFQTVRNMEALSRQREALVALGGLAAGLAHELNNPASATARAVDSLQEAGDTMLSSLTRLAEHSFHAEQFVAMDALRRQLEPASANTDAVATADREDDLMTWLDARGVGGSWQIGPALAAAGADLDWCRRAAVILTEDHLEAGLEWVASAVSAQALLDEIKESTSRISALVDAVKSYSQVDRAAQQRIDVTEGIESTLVMLRHKLGSVTVEREYGEDVPQIEANPGELNQVWTNLIDNAIDALGGAGTIRIVTRFDPECVIVEVIDDGPGMAADVQARAFEPFFTTKEVGKGTGLGLDISNRIVTERHHGEIRIDSGPGRTVIGVRLPRQPT